jgi:hypothetical protein
VSFKVQKLLVVYFWHGDTNHLSVCANCLTEVIFTLSSNKTRGQFFRNIYCSTRLPCKKSKTRILACLPLQSTFQFSSHFLEEKHCNKVLLGTRQGCRIFLGPIITKREQNTKRPQTLPNFTTIPLNFTKKYTKWP